MKKHTEARPEEAIVAHLTTQGGYVLVDYAKGQGRGGGPLQQGVGAGPRFAAGFIEATQSSAS
ncbi:hypothetical protein BH10PSE16_BH10PSE16_09450 [soil metagenome]